jgi:hypothetical protein
VQEPADESSIGLGARVRILEDDDVTAARVVQDFLDEDAVAGHQRRLHRSGRDVERLDDERLQQEREREGEQHQDGELAQERQDPAVAGVARSAARAFLGVPTIARSVGDRPVYRRVRGSDRHEPVVAHGAVGHAGRPARRAVIVGRLERAALTLGHS